MIYDEKTLSRLIATIRQIPRENIGLIKGIRCVENDEETHMNISYGYYQDGKPCVKMIHMPINSFNTWYKIIQQSPTSI